MDKFSEGTKQVVTVIVALTAFATAATSLVKALDKTVEQASYETLSRKIVELQDDNLKLHRTVEDLIEANEEPSFRYVLPFASATPPSAASAPAPGGSSATLSVPARASIKAEHPCPPGDPLCERAVAPVATPLPAPRPAPVRSKPPSWSEVQTQASKM